MNFERLSLLRTKSMHQHWKKNLKLNWLSCRSWQSFLSQKYVSTDSLDVLFQTYTVTSYLNSIIANRWCLCSPFPTPVDRQASSTMDPERWRKKTTPSWGTSLWKFPLSKPTNDEQPQLSFKSSQSFFLPSYLHRALQYQHVKCNSCSQVTAWFPWWFPFLFLPYEEVGKNVCVGEEEGLTVWSSQNTYAIPNRLGQWVTAYSCE